MLTRINVIIFLFFVYNTIPAQIFKSFSKDIQITQKGGLVFLSNVANSCSANPPLAVGPCSIGVSEMPPFGSYANNTYSIATYVDIDSDPSTFMSSSDSLNLPTCSEITWAGLYWASNGVASTVVDSVIKIKSSSSAYVNIKADSVLYSSVPSSPFTFNTYYCFKNITSYVISAGIHSRFTVANIPFVENPGNDFGGWTMVVLYKNNTLPLRQFTVFDGLALISPVASASVVSIPVSGFLTPTAGPVNFELGQVVWDGDRGPSDGASFNGAGSFVPISNSTNPTSDVFNSTITNNGVLTPFRKPSMNLTPSMDADIFAPDNSAKNYIGNGATSFIYRLITGGEGYLPQVITTAIDVFETVNSLSLGGTDINGGALMPGDVMEYKIKVSNVGDDISTNTYVVDTLSSNVTFVPGSINIIYGPNSGIKTDVLSDDQGEFDGISNVLKIRVGVGANGTIGGTVNNSITGLDSTIITYRVKVTNSCVRLLCNDTISSRAYIIGTGLLSGNTQTIASNNGVLSGTLCPLPSNLATTSIVTNTACGIPNAFNTTAICDGASFTLSATPDSESDYTWIGPNTFTANAQSIVIPIGTPTMSGIYTVTLSILGVSCQYTAATTATVNALPVINLIADNDSLCGFGNQTILNASGALTYTLINNSTLFSPTIALVPTATVIYTVVGTSSLNCINTQTTVVTLLPLPIVAVDANSVEVCGASDIQLSVSNPISNNNYLWTSSFDNYLGGIYPINNAQLFNQGTYTVTVTDQYGCKNATTVDVVVNDCELFIPELFSPNGDTKNDFFEIRGVQFYPNNKLSIYNRWGNLVYQKDSYINNWDGTPNVKSATGNGILPVGTYYVIFNYGNEILKEYHGYVQLNW